MNNGCQWLDEYAQGSDDAFGKFVRLYASLVYSIARRRLGNEALAEEAAQLVFIRVARLRPRFTNEGKLVAWLHRTATNVAIDLWRAEARRKAREAEALFMQQLADEDLEALAKQLDEAIDGLEEKEREAILLRFFAAQRMAEVGSALGISEDAAKMRVNRAVASLRKKLGKVGVACGEATLLGFLSNRVLEAAPAKMVGAWVNLSPRVGRHLMPRATRRVAIVAGSALVLMLAFYSAKTFQKEGASASIAPGDQINRQDAVDVPKQRANSAVYSADAVGYA